MDWPQLAREAVWFLSGYFFYPLLWPKMRWPLLICGGFISGGLLAIIDSFAR